jgi:hypothetical protein
MAPPQVISKPSRYMWLASCGDSSNCYLEHASSVNVCPPIRQMHRPRSTNEPTPTAGLQNVGDSSGGSAIINLGLGAD